MGRHCVHDIESLCIKNKYFLNRDISQRDFDVTMIIKLAQFGGSYSLQSDSITKRDVVAA